MVRETTCPENFRDRDVPKGRKLCSRPWHLHRHERLWDNPDGFDPDALGDGRMASQCQGRLYAVFGGPRVCTGRGLCHDRRGALISDARAGSFALISSTDKQPEPVAHLTVRAKDGIWLRFVPRDK